MNKRKLIIFKQLTIVVIMVFSIAIAANADLPDCGFGHCRVNQDKVGNLCELNAKMQGVKPEQYKTPVAILHPSNNGTYCICPCSCSIGSTLIDTINGQIRMEEIQVNDLISTPLSDIPFTSVEKKYVSDIKDGTVVQTSLRGQKGDVKLITSENHTFITQEEKVVRADKLSVGQQLLGPDGIFEVTEVPKNMKYNGSLFNFSVNQEKPQFYHHVYVNNGVYSGDWLLQTTNDTLETEVNLRSSIISIKK